MAAPNHAFASARADVARACRTLAAAGLVRGTSGNVSVREGDRVAASPTGAVLAEADAAQVAIVDRAGTLVDGPLEPTSELGLHLAVYDRREEIGAIVHTHAAHATALACVLDELPCVHYEMLALGGPIRVAGYETFGTPELAAAAAQALEGRTAVLLANHGTVTVGPDVDSAMNANELLEWLCAVYWRAAAIGAPRTLNVAQQQAFGDAIRTRRYGTVRPA